MKNLLFIPCYNCEKQITRVMASINEKVLGHFDEIIIVNNISTDNTEKYAVEFAKSHPELPFTVLRNVGNYGLGGSHKVAFNYAMRFGYDYVAVLHGDDQGDINDLLPIMENGDYTRYDCCLGARFMPASRLEGYSKFRTFGNIVYNAYFSVLSGMAVYDLGSGLNIYRTKMLKSKFYRKFPDNLTFNCYMLLAAKALNANIHFFPISWKETDQVSNVKMVNQAMRTLKIPLDYTLSTKRSFLNKEYRDNPSGSYSTKIIYTNKVALK